MSFNFGAGYTPAESQQLEAGKYRARITGVEFVNRGGYDVMDIHFQVSGKPNCKPDRMSYFDRPMDPEKAIGWDLQLTRFFDAFGIQRGNFNCNEWRGKIGQIIVSVNKKNPQYMDVYPYVEKAPSQQNNTPQNSSGQQYNAPPVQQQQQPLYAHQKTQNTQGGYNPPPLPTDNNLEVFPDDIPF